MAKIISSGRGTGEMRRHEVTCGACQCRFEFVQSESRKKEIQKDWDGIPGDAIIRVISCPECGKEVNAFPGTYF